MIFLCCVTAIGSVVSLVSSLGKGGPHQTQINIFLGYESARDMVYSESATSVERIQAAGRLATMARGAIKALDFAEASSDPELAKNAAMWRVQIREAAIK